MRRPAELFKNPVWRGRFHGPGPATWAERRRARARPSGAQQAIGSLLRRGPSEARRSRHRDELTERFGYRCMSPAKGAGLMITSASGVAGQGRSTAGSIVLLELGHIGLMGQRINVVMPTGRFHRSDTNRRSRCARRSDDTDARSGLARLEEPQALFAGGGCKVW